MKKARRGIKSKIKKILGIVSSEFELFFYDDFERCLEFAAG